MTAAMKTISGKYINLSHINNINDLDAEIGKVQQRLRQNRAEIKANFKHVPNELVHTTLGSVFPFFKKTKPANAALLTLQTLAGSVLASLFNTGKNKRTFNRHFAAVAGQIGFWCALKIIRYVRQKKGNKSA